MACMLSHTKAAMERAMKVQEVILRPFPRICSCFPRPGSSGGTYFGCCCRKISTSSRRRIANPRRIVLGVEPELLVPLHRRLDVAD